MIKNILSQGGPYLQVTNTFPLMVPINPNSGALRYNSNTYNLEVFDGNSWISITTDATIGLSSTAIDAITWATKKIKEEQALVELAKTHPAVKEALDNYTKAGERLTIVTTLTQEEK
jgi:thiazole synthase ThiGH ThiG subunit